MTVWRESGGDDFDTKSRGVEMDGLDKSARYRKHNDVLKLW